MILVWGLFSVPYLPRPKPLLWKSSARGPAWHSFSGTVVGRLGTPMFSRYQVEMASPERLDGSRGFSFLAFLVSRGWGSHRSNTVVERKGQARWVCKHLGEGGEREKLGEKIPTEAELSVWVVGQRRRKRRPLPFFTPLSVQRCWGGYSRRPLNGRGAQLCWAERGPSCLQHFTPGAISVRSGWHGQGWSGPPFFRQREPMGPREGRTLPLGALSTLTHRVPRRPPNKAFDIEPTVLSVSPAAFSYKVGFEKGGGGGGCFLSSEEAS